MHIILPDIQMFLILSIALLGYLVSARFGQSAMLGEILAGFLIGPSILGLITYTSFVSSLAHVGAIVLLFAIGLEFKLHEIFNVKHGFIALIGILVPWICGYFFAQWFSLSFSVSIFIGTALTATSIAITAGVLREMNKLHTSVAKVIIGAAVIDDILGLLALTISNGVIAGNLSTPHIVLILIKVLVFLCVGGIVGSTVLRRLILHIDKKLHAAQYHETAFIMAIMIAFLYASIAEVLGISGIVGAFLAGASLGKIDIEKHKKYDAGAEYLVTIFGAVFFVSLGILADIHALSMNMLYFTLLLTLLAFATKIIGCGIASLGVGISTKESLAIGIGMIPRGEVAMIVALIGLQQKILSQNLYVSIIIMSMLTTIVTPLLLKPTLKEKQS